MRLRRARMRAWDDLPRGEAGVKGTLLVPDRPPRVREEEVPAAGVTVERRWQFARCTTDPPTGNPGDGADATQIRNS